jgi:TonB-linked SusC/RagA family outer membrane protein
MRFTSDRTRLPGALVVALCLAAGVVQAQGQTGAITGAVTDRVTNTPLSSVRVSVLGTNRAAVTNQQGRYTLAGLPAGTYQVQATIIGYAATTNAATVAAGQAANVDFGLRPAAVSLDAVTVTTPAGEQRARESGNAITNIDLPKVIENQTTASLADALSGRDAGVQVLQSGGTVGTGTRIRIRGQTSLSLSNEPVYYVDGVRVESGDNSLSIGTGGQAPSRINDINPEDIANVEVVKGPAAATLYGTQAANGVIRITTKHGVAGPARWRIYSEGGIMNDKNQYPTNYFGWGHRDSVPPTGPVIQIIQQCRLLQSLATVRPCVIDSLTTYNVLMDPKQTPIGTGYRGQVGLQVQGGTDQVQYYLSGDYQDDLGIYRLPDVEYARLTTAYAGIAPAYEVYRPNEQKQTSIRSNIHVLPIPQLDITGNLGIVQSRARLPQNDNNVTGFLPSGLFGRGQEGSPFIWGFFLPGDVFQILTDQDISRVTGSLSSTWRPRTFLTWRANVGLDYTGRNDIQFQSRGQGPNFGTFRQGRRSDNRFTIFHYTTDLGGTAQFQLTPTINSKTSVGLQFLKDNFFGVLANGQNMPPGAKSITSAAIRTATEQTTLAVTLGTYIEQQFGWRDRVFITGAIRHDRNSTFGIETRSVNYPKIQGSWVISDEAFYPHSMPVSNLKLRFAYGASGQQPGSVDALLFYLGQTATVFQGATASDQPGIDLSAFGNLKLKPEWSSELELGFDAGLFDDAARLELTYYNKRTKDALINRRLPPSQGINQTRFENIGSVQNRGLEVLLSTQRDVGSSARVDATVSIARNTNKLLKLGVPPIVNGEIQQREGYPLFGFWDRPILGFNDANHNGIIEVGEVTVGDTALYLGSSIPRTVITLNAGLSFFKNRLRLAGQLDYRGDWKAYNLTERFRCVGAGFNCAAVNDPNDNLADQARAVAAGSSARGFTQAGYITNGTFMRLREASLTYTAPEAWAKLVRAQSMQFSLTGRNLLKWTNYDGIDPELNGNGQSDFPDDFLTAPPIRTVAVRVSLGF